MLQHYAPPLSGLTIEVEILRTLIANSNLLAQLSEYLPVGVWVLNSEGQIIYANAQAREIWGGVRSIHAGDFHEFKGWWLASGKRLEPDDWAAARAFQHGEISTNDEITIESFDGARKIIRSRAIPIRTSEGAVVGVIALHEDITVERKAVVAQEDADRKLKQALSAAHMVVWDWDLATDAFITSGRISDTLEFAPPGSGQSVGELSQLVHPDDLPRLNAETTMAVLRDHCFVSEFRVVNPNDGTVQWLEAQGVANLDAAGEASSLRGVLSNITLRKHAEETLRVSQEHARVLAEELQVMVDASKEKMILLDDQGIIRGLSVAAAEEFGQARGELIGHPAREYVRPEEYLRLRFMAADLLRHPGSQVRHLLEFQSTTEPAWWCSVKASVLAVGSRKMFVLTLERMPIIDRGNGPVSS